MSDKSKLDEQNNCHAPSDDVKEQETSSKEEAKNEDKEDLNKKYEDLKNEYLRTFADFENAKKRLEREKSTALEYANENFARDLLPILDALENAKLAAKDVSAIFDGINLVLDNFTKTLSKHGIVEIPCEGEFDPNMHECIMQIEHENLESGQIASVLQKGYTLKERILRPSMVSVVK